MPRAATSTDVFNAIAELRRREIIAVLVDGKEHIGNVVQTLRMKQPAGSKHLRVLLKVVIISVAKQGPLLLYRQRKGAETGT